MVGPTLAASHTLVSLQPVQQVLQEVDFSQRTAQMSACVRRSVISIVESVLNSITTLVLVIL